MQKRLIIACILTLLVINVNIVFAYTDTEGHWAEHDISTLSSYGIITGYQDGTFMPNNNLTRAELITIINRMLNNTVQSTKYVPDISTSNWYYSEVKKALNSGFVTGDNDGNIRPNDLITREEAVVMLQRAFIPVNEEKIVISLKDYDDVSSWAKDSFTSFIMRKYISGYNDNTIRPKANITRAEVVKIISRMCGNFVSYGELKGTLHNNVLVNGDKVSLNNVTIDGDLIICEGASNLKIENTIINGDFILRREIQDPIGNFQVYGRTFKVNTEPIADNSKYTNDEYGISFSIPEGAKVVYITDEKQKPNFKQKNLMTVRINHNDDLYFTSFSSGLLNERNRFALPYSEIKTGYIGYYKYAVYGSEKDNSYFIYIKRDNVEYSIYFYNIANLNVVDNLVESIKLYEGSLITSHGRKQYNNPQLFLKFNYIDYVVVDDSYNTGIVNEDEGFYKLIIQVTNIIDMSNYTIDQLKTILVGLEDTQSEIIDSRITKVYACDAIEYTVKNEDKLTKSLYIVLSNKLYHFVFTADEKKMLGAGEEIYEDIISNIEFQN